MRNGWRALLKCPMFRIRRIIESNQDMRPVLRRSLDRLPACDRSATVPSSDGIFLADRIARATRCSALMTADTTKLILDDQMRWPTAERARQEISHGRLLSACR